MMRQTPEQARQLMARAKRSRARSTAAPVEVEADAIRELRQEVKAIKTELAALWTAHTQLQCDLNGLKQLQQLQQLQPEETRDGTTTG